MAISERGESDTLTSMQFAMSPYGEGGVLVTREAGSQARYDVERALHGLTPGQPVALDFSDVVAISVPFADECLGQLLSGRLAGYYEEHPILALNATDDVRETVAAALRPRHLFLLGMSDGQVELIGGDELMNATMEAAQRLGTFAAFQLADELHISPQAANNRLKALVRSGALYRSRVIPARGGKEFEYAVPQVALSHSERRRTRVDGRGSRGDGAGAASSPRRRGSARR
jgi:hypothetical protein